MSFRWKWVIAAFLIQLLVGSLFLATWYFYFEQAGDNRMSQERERVSQVVELFRERKNAPLNAEDALLLVQEVHRVLQPRRTELLKGKQVLIPLESEQAAQASDPWGWALRIDEVFKDSTLRVTLSVPDTEYTLRVQPELGDYYSRRAWYLETVVSLTLLSAVSSSIILLALTRLIVKRLLRLRDKALALQAGQVGVRAAVQGNDEIAILAQAFNDMASAVEINVKRISASRAELEVERNRLETILSSSNTGVAYLDGDSKVQYYNNSLLKILGITAPLQSESSLSNVLSLSNMAASQRKVLSRMFRENLYNNRAPVELEMVDGRVIRLRFQLVTDNERSEHGVLLADDISVHKSVQDLREEVETDPLTRVMNRRGFELTVNRRIPKLLEDETLGMIYVDLDGFKAVNDTLGHKAGDQVLRSAAAILTRSVRNIDVVARLGGDEFAVVVSQATEALLINMCKRILASFADEVLFQRILKNHDLGLSCSLGISLYPTSASSAQELLEQADAAMYEAKRSGKGCYRMAKPTSEMTDEF